MVIRTKALENRAKNTISKDQLQALKLELEYFKNLDYLDEEQTNSFNNLRIEIYKEEEKQDEKL